ncbi:sensor histidine kinase [Pullulanibacillus sp. KACC 23026]|uniref:sensor histidine kinase n=1 Tax=Pullulanibacillus sp. KACC 23026 TaxID=3028315 RepID=UPI0023B07C8E|nr:sensor histidine kinase [Pullulanibacillus sp. KACC 23026]WEG14630.1 sensor histidine kinase [Pullulanibacillus sp. KACC 23026]
MRNWFHIIPKNTGLSIYVWIIFCILPFYFIMRSLSLLDICFGVLLVFLFYITNRLSFNSKTGFVYLWVSIQMAISLFMTIYFSYIYFGLFLAFFIGKIQHKGGFLSLYIVHLCTTIVAITFGFFFETKLYTSQLPFVIISIIGIILLPINMRNREKREKLEVQLEDANKKLSQLMVMEERQRIARDLHDTLGQKLSLIGLKSDLAQRLIKVNPDSAKIELRDINQTARTALKEVREMVTNMRAVKLKDELIKVKQILDAANIDVKIEGSADLKGIPLFVENILSMCLKEAVTNIVKHSQATRCRIKITSSQDDVKIEIHDNGKGFSDHNETHKGHGIAGMKERLEFVNGILDYNSLDGTLVTINVPNVRHPNLKGDQL